MEKPNNLIDVLARTGDPDNDDRADDILKRLEKEVQAESAPVGVSRATRFLIRFGKGPEGIIVF